MGFFETIDLTKICGNVAPWLWSGSEVICAVPAGEPHERHGGNGWTWEDDKEKPDGKP